MDREEEKKREEAEVPLKCKRQGEEEALGSKKVKNSKARTLRKPFLPGHQEVPAKRSQTTLSYPSN